MGNCASKRRQPEPSIELELQPFRFLDLPPELRNQVYDELLTLKAAPGDGQIEPDARKHNAWPVILRVCQQIHDESSQLLYSLSSMEIYLVDDIALVNGKASLNLFLDHDRPLRFLESLDVYIICRSPGNDWYDQSKNRLLFHIACLACLIHTRTLSIGAGIKPLRALRLHFSLLNSPPQYPLGPVHQRPLEDFQRPLLYAFRKLRGIKEVEITGLENDADWVEGIRRQIMADVQFVSGGDFELAQRWHWG